MIRSIERENTGRMCPGQDLVVAGYAGWAGTEILVRQERDKLSSRYSGIFLDEIICRKEAMPDGEPERFAAFGAAEWEPAGEGGIMTALWNLLGAYRLGMEVTLRRIPVRQETIEVCEFFELNPYRLYSKGCVLLAADNGGRLAESLVKEQIPAQVIGRVMAGADKIIYHGEGQAYLDRPQKDELTKIIPNYLFNK